MYAQRIGKECECAASPLRAGRHGSQTPSLNLLRRLVDSPSAPILANPSSSLASASRPPLMIGHAHDPAEQEAEEAARSLGKAGPCACGCKGPCGHGKASTSLSRDSLAHTGEGTPAPPIVHEALASPGRPLGAAERDFFERHFGHDFSRVRVHTGALAAASAGAVDARAYTVGDDVVLGEGAMDRRVMAHELAHVAQQTGGLRPLLQRQKKTVGGPLDLKPDPCITLPGVGTVCGQDAAGACEKFPGIPGCGTVCKIFGCDKPATPKTSCPPGWRASMGKDFAGQCCKGETDSAQACCTPDRIAFKDNRCCVAGEVVDNDQHCIKSSDIPATPVPGGTGDVVEKFCKDYPNLCKQQPPPLPLPGQVKQLGVLWTDEIHFNQDKPGIGGGGDALTAEGAKELESVLSWLRISSDLEVRLIGSASWEGPKGSSEAYNQALASRRVAFIVKALGGFSSRVADPFLSDGAESGCQSLGTGRWSCGSKNAPPDTSRPEDRVVKVTFSRNKLTLPLLKFERPGRSLGGTLGGF